MQSTVYQTCMALSANSYILRNSHKARETLNAKNIITVEEASCMHSALPTQFSPLAWVLYPFQAHHQFPQYQRPLTVVDETETNFPVEHYTAR